MKTNSLLVRPGTWALLAVATTLAGCGGGSSEVTSTPAVKMSLSTASTSFEVTQQISFLLTANSGTRTFTGSRIDFDGDGSWDDGRAYNTASVYTTFTHTYANTGKFTVVAVVVDDQGIETSRTLDVDVDVAQDVPVTFGERAVASVNGECNAIGPMIYPASNEGVVPLSRTETRLLRGMYPHGATVEASQSFGQQRFNKDGEYYSCDYELTLYAGEPGKERAIAGQRCTTTSTDGDDNVVVWQCSVHMAGVVP